MTKSKLLIVDNDPALRYDLNLRLRASGYETVSAPDGISAVNVAKKEYPDVIILDLSLPSGGGYSVMERLRATVSLARVPIIIWSAQSAALHKGRCLGAGAVAFFQKPADDKKLLDTIAWACNERRTVFGKTRGSC